MDVRDLRFRNALSYRRNFFLAEAADLHQLEAPAQQIASVLLKLAAVVPIPIHSQLISPVILHTFGLSGRDSPYQSLRHLHYLASESSDWERPS